MKYIDNPSGCFIDRYVVKPNLEANDVLILTLDAEDFLEKSLYTFYREIPINRLLVCDGGSKDNTLEILKKFPRVELHVRPDMKTTGKVLEYLISLVNTEWCVIVDSDIELSIGWYDEMYKNRSIGDVLENGKRIMAYHFYREDQVKLRDDVRPLDFCHLAKKSALKNYQCDDDFNWRFTDYLFRQSVEKGGFKYAKINTTSHIHNSTEGSPYKSDTEKSYQKIIFKEPEYLITDKKKLESWRIKHAKAVVKYLDPEHPVVKASSWSDVIVNLDREWIENNGPDWLKKYDEFTKVNPSIIEPVPISILYEEYAIKIMEDVLALRTKQISHHSELSDIGQGTIWTRSQISTSSYPYPIRRAEFPWAINKANLYGSMKILDIGSGVSQFPIYLASRGHEVYSIDNDETLVNKIAPKLAEWSGTNVNYSLGDVIQIKFEDNTFDRIFCISVLEHLEEELVNGKYVSYKKKNLDIKAIAEMLRVLKPGGILVITVEWSEVPEEERSYKLQDIYKRLLRDYRHLLATDKKPEIDWQVTSKQCLDAWRSFPPFYYTVDAWAMGIVLRKPSEQITNKFVSKLINKLTFKST